MKILSQRDELPFMELPPKIVRLSLTADQTRQLAPLAVAAAHDRHNVLFAASVVPFWSLEDNETVWELQVVKVQATLGYKIAKLIRDSCLNQSTTSPSNRNP